MSSGVVVSKQASSGKPLGVRRKSASPELENPPEVLPGTGWQREITPPQRHDKDALGLKRGGSSSGGAHRGATKPQGHTPSVAERSQQAMKLHKERMEKRRLEKESAERKRNELW